MLVELSDLYGALNHYMKHNVIAFNWRKKVDDIIELIDSELLEIGMDAKEIVKFSRITERAFESGQRK